MTGLIVAVLGMILLALICLFIICLCDKSMGHRHFIYLSTMVVSLAIMLAICEYQKAQATRPLFQTHTIGCTND